MKKILIATTLIAVASNAYALTQGGNATLKEGTFNCKKLTDFYEMISYIQDKDQQGMMSLITSGKCRLLKESMTVEIQNIDEKGFVSFITPGGHGGWAVQQFFEE
ncbi:MULTISPECIES: hypothetical protein [Enterobacteriaceae]|uniref:hypothetical protein n=1 Tax=Enterobacteriaceae TaxID=543 RepID=UPI0029DBC05D|nr:hypothetical protein [Enterobacter hormaechei]EMC9751513.1 hypothetical protein [Enterobacter cloacae]HBS6565010.1 hypothetical protein [Klebsiella pneumoniae]HCC5810659.1 hypothetical protein [Citrobacter freundii]MDX7045671.1 hypothetical protein [Enterobacter hormaechei]HCC5831430.1 hypothetical protein [Citrobacter freundii]